MDSFPGELSCCLHLPIGFDAVEADHDGRLAAIGGVGPLVVVEGDPVAAIERASSSRWVRSRGRAWSRISVVGIGRIGAMAQLSGKALGAGVVKAGARPRPSAGG